MIGETICQRGEEHEIRNQRENEGLGNTRVLRDLMARRVAPAVAKQATDDAFRESMKWR